jgi:hypothetical protein
MDEMRRERTHRRLGFHRVFRRGCALEVVAGGHAVTLRENGGVNGIQQVMAESWTWLALLIASSSNAEWQTDQLCASAASGGDGVVVWLRYGTNGWHEEMRQNEEEGSRRKSTGRPGLT